MKCIYHIINERYLWFARYTLLGIKIIYPVPEFYLFIYLDLLEKYNLIDGKCIQNLIVREFLFDFRF